MDLNEVARNASQSQNAVAELQITVKQLQARVERHALVIQVLKDMLLTGGKAAEGEFHDRLEQATEQKTDARFCRNCGKPMSQKHNRCIYCGEARPPELL